MKSVNRLIFLVSSKMILYLLIIVSQLTIHSMQSVPDICNNPVIDSAVRLSAESESMLFFKQEYFWVLNITSSSLSKPEKISDKFKIKDFILKTSEASWVGRALNKDDGGNGQILVLLTIVQNDISFENGQFNVVYSERLSIQDYWIDADEFIKNKKIEDISQLQTIGGKEINEIPVDRTQSNIPDLVVVSTDYYAILWYDQNLKKYVTHNPDELKLLSESDKLDLTFFKTQARDNDYWKGKSSKSISSFMNITAVVYFPTSDEFFVFGKNSSYCRVSADGSDSSTHLCILKDTKKLFGCKSSANTSEPSSSTEANSNNPGVTRPTKRNTNSEAGTNKKGENESEGLTVTVIIVLVIVAVILLVLIAIVCLVIRRGKKDTSNGSLEDQVKLKPIDNRFGQLDSNVQLNMFIASPSYQALDQQMAEENKVEDVKSESGSDSPKATKNARKDK